MPRPKKGDLLRWYRDDGYTDWRVITHPRKSSNIGEMLYAKARVEFTTLTTKMRTVGAVEEIGFMRKTVEESKWQYVETPFQQYIRETLEAAESGEAL